MYYISFAYADKIYGGVSEADGLNEGGYGDLEGAEEAADRILENCSGVKPDLIRIFETEHETPVWVIYVRHTGGRTKMTGNIQ